MSYPAAISKVLSCHSGLDLLNLRYSEQRTSTKGDDNYWTPDQVRSDVTRFFSFFKRYRPLYPKTNVVYFLKIPLADSKRDIHKFIIVDHGLTFLGKTK
jgi:hypothetical protein